MNFLILLSKNNDLDKLDSIIHGLKELRNQKTNTVEVFIETSKSLDQEELNSLKESLEQKLNKKIMRI